MSKIKVRATMMFVHGRINAERGQELELSKGEADDLTKAGLVEHTTENSTAQPAVDAQMASAPEADPPSPDPQPGDVVTETGHDDDDILGEKAAAPAENKMAKAPANKSTKK